MTGQQHFNCVIGSTVDYRLGAVHECLSRASYPPLTILVSVIRTSIIHLINVIVPQKSRWVWSMYVADHVCT